MVRPHPLLSPQRQAEGRHRADHAPAARRRSDRPCAGAGGLGGRELPGDRRGGAQRFQRLHELGDPGQEPSTCCAGAWNTPS
jgi:hypothetical protein